MSSVWRVQLLGGFLANRGGQTIVRFRSQKTAALFAFLAYHGRRVHPREKLIEQFWPDTDLNAGRNSLSTSLSCLRQQFHGNAMGRAVLFHANRHSVWLNCDLLETDTARLEATLNLAASQRDPERMESLKAAVDLYQGELLPGHYEPWIFPEQILISERVFQAYHQLIGSYFALGDLETALEFAHRCLRMDPLREETHAALIRIQRGLGQSAQALRQYRELERVLGKELDLAPAAKTRSLVHDLLPTVRAKTSTIENSEANTVGNATSTKRSHDWQATGGALPPESPYYIERPEDEVLCTALAHQHSIVLIKGPRQTGKSSALARGLMHVRGKTRVVLTDFESLGQNDFQSLDRLLQVLAQSVIDQLELEWDPTGDWHPRRGPTLNFSRFLRRVICQNELPLIWAMDEVDRLFHCTFGDDVFALFRSWHNERALLPETPWSRLTLGISYATEARLFIRDVNLSPFNVGTRLELGDLSLEETSELNRRYRSPVTGLGELNSLQEWLGGHPFLTQRGLATLRSRNSVVSREVLDWCRGDGVFGAHLRKLIGMVRSSSDAVEAVEYLLQGGKQLPESIFFLLKSGGILTGKVPAEVRFRCRIYETYLRQQFEAATPHPFRVRP